MLLIPSHCAMHVTSFETYKMSYDVFMHAIIPAIYLLTYGPPGLLGIVKYTYVWRMFPWNQLQEVVNCPQGNKV